MATIGTPRELDVALRRGFSEVGARPKPEVKMTEIVEALGALGVTASLDAGLLILQQGNTIFDSRLCLRGFAAKPENQKFFVSAADDPKTWTLKMRSDYISAHGADAYGKLVNGKALEPAIKVLDKNMSKQSYLALTLQEKVAFINEFKAEAVTAIMGKKK